MKPNPLSCFGSIFKRNPNQNLLSGSSSEELFVPDDMMICIFVRLDVRDIVRIRCVCKKWKDITSTPQFLDSLLLMPISDLPMILQRIPKKASMELFSIDKWWGTKPLIYSVGCDYFVNTGHDQPFPYCSQNGFTLTAYPGLARSNGDIIRNIIVGPKEYIIRNPLTREQVKIILHGKPDAAGVPDIFGIFLHPIKKEYITLWKVEESPDYNRTQYKMLNLGSGSSKYCWRNIGDIWSHCWIGPTSIICLDGFVYWMVSCHEYDNKKRVIGFEIKTEEFTQISLPSNEDGENFDNTNLLNDDGFLSLVRVIYNNSHDEVITIKKWTMKDPQTRFWIASQYVVSVIECPREIRKLMAVAIVNSELVIVGNLENKVGLFKCSLKSGTIRNLSKNTYSWDARFWAHQPSIASLRNCQPIIHIHEE